jgi:hypothetical protein
MEKRLLQKLTVTQIIIIIIIIIIKETFLCLSDFNITLRRDEYFMLRPSYPRETAPPCGVLITLEAEWTSEPVWTQE